MFKKIGESWVPMLRWPSMILLAIFLSIYLFKSYQTEKENLKKEVGYLFVNAVNAVEGNLMNQFIFKSDSFKTKIDDVTSGHHDSVKVMVIAGRHERGNIEINRSTQHIIRSNELPPLHSSSGMETNVVIRRNRTDDPHTLQQAEGVISLILRSEIDTNGRESMHRIKIGSVDLTDTLKSKFDLNLNKAGLKIQYTLNSHKDTVNVHDPNHNIAGTYHDLASNETYEVHIKTNHRLIIKKLLPEFLLALLLMACLGLAFYSMSTTIRHEKNLMAAKSDFIQNMTHELKTPIATVRVALEALQQFDGIQDERKRIEYLKISRNELDRLSLLVDRVLTMSGIDRALPAAHKEIVHLSTLISHITDTFRLQAEKQNIQIITHLSEPDISIHADPQWISGIIFNLLDNAIKYSDKDFPTIKINATKKNEHILLSIMDNGPGIAPDYQSKIFEKFYRIPQGNVHTVKGHGLGLAFVWRIVQEMGGTISIESEMEKGTIFNVSLPAA